MSVFVQFMKLQDDGEMRVRYLLTACLRRTQGIQGARSEDPPLMCSCHRNSFTAHIGLSSAGIPVLWSSVSPGFNAGLSRGPSLEPSP